MPVSVVDVLLLGTACSRPTSRARLPEESGAGRRRETALRVANPSPRTSSAKLCDKLSGPPPPYKRDQRDAVTVWANVFGLGVRLETSRAMMGFARARPQKRPATRPHFLPGSLARCLGGSAIALVRVTGQLLYPGPEKTWPHIPGTPRRTRPSSAPAPWRSIRSCAGIAAGPCRRSSGGIACRAHRTSGARRLLAASLFEQVVQGDSLAPSSARRARICQGTRRGEIDVSPGRC